MDQTVAVGANLTDAVIEGSLAGADLTDATVDGLTVTDDRWYNDTVCPDGTLSSANLGMCDL